MNSLQMRIIALIIVVIAEGGLYPVAFGYEGPLRWVPVMITILVIPGAVVVPRLHVADAPTLIALTVIVSLSAWTLAATLMAVTGLWHPLVVAVVLALLSSVVLVRDVVRLARDQTPTADSGSHLTWNETA